MNENRLSAALTALAISIVVSAIILEHGGTRPANAATTDQDSYSCRSSAVEEMQLVDYEDLPGYMRSGNYPD